MDSVSNIAEWLTLPKLDVPQLQDENENGRVYYVLKIGMLLADPDECKGNGVQANVSPIGKSILPTCMVEENGEKHLCQLPLELTDWAERVLGLAHMGGSSPFPCKVEFGCLRDRIYAEMI